MQLSVQNMIFTLLTWALLAGVGVYFTPLNGYGEFHLPIIISLAGDMFAMGITLLIFIFFHNMNEKFDGIEITSIVFLLFTFLLSLFHLLFWELNEFFHYYFRNIFYYFSIGLVVYHYGKKISTHKWDTYFKTLFYVISTISFLLLFLEGITGNAGFFLWEGSRLCGTMINHNSFGALMIFFLYWSFFKYDGLLNLYSIISLFLIFLTGSLTAYIGVILLLLRKPIIIVALIIVSLISWELFSETLLEFSAIYKIHEILTNENTHLTSLSARIEQFYWVIDNVFDNLSTFLFGVKSTIFLRFDSQYYQIISNLGVMSLFFFIIYGLTAFLTVSKKSSRLYILWLFCIAMFMTSFLTRWNMILVFFAILAYGASVNDKFLRFKNIDNVKKNGVIL